MADLSTQSIPDRPFMLFGQMTTADSSRSPAGTESAWAYTHLPRGMADDESADKLAVAVDRVLEEHAPEFTERIVAKVVQRPWDLQRNDANLHTGAVNGGTSQLYQQLIFRPTPGSAGQKHPSRTCTSAALAPARAAASTVYAAAMPRERRFIAWA